MGKFLSILIGVISLCGCATITSDDKNSNIDNDLAAIIIGDQQLALNPAGARKCHELRAVIPVGGKVEGPNCTDNKAVVNGWSEKCVANNACNAGQRRAELNGAARTFCANWCAAKKCGFNYTARNKCDSSWCFDSKFCQNNCQLPKLNACYFQQAAPNYNCQCFPANPT